MGDEVFAFADADGDAIVFTAVAKSTVVYTVNGTPRPPVATARLDARRLTPTGVMPCLVVVVQSRGNALQHHRPIPLRREDLARVLQGVSRVFECSGLRHDISPPQAQAVEKGEEVELAS
eukprot:Hpha_TRINITY_DN23929_c0_g1::TRINITY_DN23929_c0_g1_i1::g.137717::m.137717